MIKRASIIVLVIFLLISVLEMVIYFEVFTLDQKIFDYSILGYVFVSIICVFLLNRLIFKQGRVKAKEEAQIIYKNYDIEKTNEEFLEKKSADKTQKVVTQFMQSIEEYPNLEKLTEGILNRMSKVFSIVQGIFYLWDNQKEAFTTANTYAYYSEDIYKQFKIGEGITGQVAKNKKFLLIDNVPKGYITVTSGLGEGTPKYLAFVPLIKDEKVIGIIEIASFVDFPHPSDKIFMSISEKIVPLIQKFV